MKKKILPVLLLLVLAIILFILTPTENPLLQTDSDSTPDYSLCLPANDGNLVYHPNYWLSYSEEHEQAQWVATVLRADNVLLPTVDRSNVFLEDPDIVTGSAVSSDYSNSGFDRGHLLSFASNGWNEETGNSSFYMSNMSPQYPNTNRYTYERLEEAERTATVQNNILYVVHGPVLTDGPFETIGKKNKISVPNYYFVCFLDYTGNEHKAIGFLIPNDNVNYKEITQFAKTVDEIETVTELDFWPLLPDDEENKLESSFSVEEWDLSSFNRNKVALKYGYNLNSLEMKEDIIQREPVNLREEIQYLLFRTLGSLKIEIISMFR